MRFYGLWIKIKAISIFRNINLGTNHFGSQILTHSVYYVCILDGNICGLEYRLVISELCICGYSLFLSQVLKPELHCKQIYEMQFKGKMKKAGEPGNSLFCFSSLKLLNLLLLLICLTNYNRNVRLCWSWNHVFTIYTLLFA